MREEVESENIGDPYSLDPRRFAQPARSLRFEKVAHRFNFFGRG
jgi:hypothetical protein